MSSTAQGGFDQQAAEKLASLSRSERVKRVFGFEPFDYQADILDSPTPDVSVNCGRQVGKTEIGGLIPADYALTHRGEDVMIAAKFQETADEMFRRTKEHFEATGLSHDDLGVANPNKTEWEFDTGARVYSRSLNSSSGTDGGDAVRGKLPKCIVIDEAALVEDGVYEKVIEPMFATHGDDHELYLMSTPRGKSGYHYQKHVYDDDWDSYHVPTRANPLVSDEWLAKQRSKVDDLTWKQEYLGEFVEEGEVYLPSDLVRPAVVEPSPSRSGGSHAWLGVDVAREGHDRTVYAAIDGTGGVFLINSEERSTIPSVVGRIRSLDETHGFSGILIDENAVGGGVVDFSNEAADLARKTVPVTFSTKSKQTMYQGLKKAFEAEEIRLPEHDRLVHELTSLEFDFTQHGKLRVHHPPGGHDDHPDALALAHFGRMKAQPSQSSDAAGVRSF